MIYTSDKLLVLGKRLNNSIRPYLLINPLQAKHIPVSPSAALDMMSALGMRVKKSAPGARLVIGFAETATAIGAAVAQCLGSQCYFLCTTREEITSVKNWIDFREEHSHAAEQKLAADHLDELFSSTDTIVFVDDELSTGKTLVNMTAQLLRQFPAVRNKHFIIASVINRLTDENIARLESFGIKCVSLLKIPNEDYSSAITAQEVRAAEEAPAARGDFSQICSYSFPDPRTGVVIGDYCSALLSIAEDFARSAVLTGKKIAVIGTEEAMLPALILGRTLEKQDASREVKCHSTTRSPIGISSRKGYPIFSGYSLTSFYDSSRRTFLYNIAQYDTVIIITDSAVETSAAGELCAVFSQSGCRDIRLITGGKNVQHL